ncbi:hypothetical protein SAMN05192569_102028 [Parageobacillus thermantarcticus]|uniref:Uncharacterized protein n=1 Tax=Parageobacillus thermantarcticus TaxID=186116 RepID=A0A1I0TBL7_9BACL|nr:hypothetical protein [Parageobacillus thermantarcticus]SFA49172.1 hypothetical protein SAMN05192569_102028 [Parageobacillus thermantarcticus]
MINKKELETADMTQLLEIINAKGDEGELEQIVELVWQDEMFSEGKRALAKDGGNADEKGGEYPSWK